MQEIMIYTEPQGKVKGNETFHDVEDIPPSLLKLLLDKEKKFEDFKL